MIMVFKLSNLEGHSVTVLCISFQYSDPEWSAKGDATALNLPLAISGHELRGYIC